MANKITDNLVLEDVEIIFRNFSGKEDKYNREGDRNFCVVIDDLQKAEELAGIGWNIKPLRPLEEGGEPGAYLPVAVSYKRVEPNIYMVTGKNQVRLSESTVGNLDFADIKHVDLIVSPYNWEVGDKSGTKAYCKTMYVTIDEDPFASKYKFDSMDEQLDDIPFM